MTENNLMFKEIRSKRGQKLYKDTESDRIYEESRGGFSWPEAIPAFVCVVGQEYKTGVLYVLEETQLDNVVDLARTLDSLGSVYKLTYWIGDREGEKKLFEELLLNTSRAVIDSNKYFNICQFRLPPKLSIAVQVLRMHLKLNTLRLPAGGILENKLKELNQLDLRQEELQEKYPEIMVLANVVYDFPTMSQVLDRHKPIDAWADDFEDREGGSWMSA
jgi:hypothetical protein